MLCWIARNCSCFDFRTDQSLNETKKKAVLVLWVCVSRLKPLTWMTLLMPGVFINASETLSAAASVRCSEEASGSCNATNA